MKTLIRKGLILSSLYLVTLLGMSSQAQSAPKMPSETDEQTDEQTDKRAASRSAAKSTSDSPTAPSGAQRTLGSITAVIPGALVGGVGHWVIGQQSTAEALFWTKLGGTVGVVAGGAALATSGASELVTPWAIPTLLISGATFMIPTALDLIGVWSPPSTPPPQSSFTAPLLSDRGRLILGVSGASRETSLVEPHPLFKLSLAHDLGSVAYQVSGSWADEQSRYEARSEVKLRRGRGWGLWARVGFTSHLMTERSLSLHQGELSFVAPLRLGALLGPTLSAMSAQLSVGWSGGALTYEGASSDAFTGVIGGFILTHHSDRDRNRASIRYEHRHDDWVGGAIIPGLGSGVFGYLSAALSRRVVKTLWVSIEASYGASHLYALNLEYILDGDS